MQFYQQVIKPFIDISVALIAVVVLSPVIIIITILLFFANQGKPFFTQLRPGKNEKIFRLVKFKTMNDRRDADGELLPDAVRLTGIGKFIRKTSLDEIPQLLNVIKADMSFVGPRPLLVEYLPLYNETERLRHSVKPGITGWAQVNGRNAISWQQKFELDVWYAKHISFGLDLRIIFRTIGKVLRSEGIAQEGQATMEKFKGTNPTLHAQ